MDISKKVRMYLGLIDKDINDFKYEIMDDGEKYVTDNVKNYNGNILAIEENGQDFVWL